MRRSKLTRFIEAVLLLLTLTLQSGSAGELPEQDADAQLLKRAGVGTDEKSLQKFLSQQASFDEERIKELIRLLGSSRFAEREASGRELLVAGWPALPALRRAAKGDDADVARRAREAIERIEATPRTQAVASSAIRLLTRQNSPDTVKTILAYLAVADDPVVEEEVYYSLDVLVRRHKSVDALRASVTDRIGKRRAVAGCLIARRGGKRDQETVTALLRDEDPGVRLRTAQGFLGAKERAALPVLAELLTASDLGIAWQAEELLRYAAGETAPSALIRVGGREAQEACQKAWQGWLGKWEQKLDFAAMDESTRRPGLFLVCDPGTTDADGRVWMTGCDGVTRWELTKLPRPVDARLSKSGERLLVAEAATHQRAWHRGGEPRTGEPMGGGVSERSLDGRVLWAKRGIGNPSLCDRLAGGSTLIAGQDIREMIVLFEDGEIREGVPPGLPDWVKRFEYPRQLSDGRLICTVVGVSGGSLGIAYLDPGKGSAERLPSAVPSVASGYILEPLQHSHNSLVANLESEGVVEINSAGQVVWQVPMKHSFHAVRLRDGSTLIGTIREIIEVNPEGKVVWKTTCSVDPRRVRPEYTLVRFGFDTPRPLNFEVPAVVARCLRGLKHPDPKVRTASANQLAELRGKASGAIEALTALETDPDPTVRTAAKTALSAIGIERMNALLTEMKSPEGTVRASAIWELQTFIAAQQVVSALLAALDDPEPKVRAQAANILGAPDAAFADKVVAALIRALRDSDPEVRLMAVHSLGRKQAHAKSVSKVLLDCIESPDRRFSTWASDALGKLNGLDEESTPKLMHTLQSSKYPWARASAIAALAAIPGARKQLSPLLFEAIRGKGIRDPKDLENIRLACVMAYGRIGASAEEEVPRLMQVLQDTKAEVEWRTYAARALGAIGTFARSALPALEEVAVSATDPELRRAASTSLDKVRGPN